jgi:hypothetical protein
MKSHTSIRQGQMISPFGVGALHVSSNGISLITAGLDYWFRPETADQEDSLYREEFRIEETRLQKILGVDALYSPPDYRRWSRGSENQPNKGVKIPFLRFPAYYFCQNPKCHYIQRLVPVQQDDPKPICRKCQKKRLVPVPFVAICDHGHAQEFPWNEWAHSTAHPSCDGSELYFNDTGVPGLAGLEIECKGCTVKRKMVGVTSAENAEETTLTNDLSDQERYTCLGEKSWLFNATKDNCTRPVRASLRGAGNIYFPVVKSAIHIPLFGIPPALQHAFENNTALTALLDITPNVSIDRLKEHASFSFLNDFPNEEITKAIEIYNSAKNPGEANQAHDSSVIEIQAALKLEEYSVLSTECNAEDLKVRPRDISLYSNIISKNFDTVCLVERLRETRALAGFSRVYPDTQLRPHELQNLLWQEAPTIGRRWLPANVVYGEGIFLNISPNRVQAWENRPNVLQRMDRLNKNYANALALRGFPSPRLLTPRFALLHTLAHVIINQLTFDAGYSTSSLRERLYVSEGTSGMSGLMIYTAAGDADGTLGGLVRLGDPGNLERTLERGIENARWCSADPICMEMGSQGGQGPDSCNLAVCHNCGLLPETACEEFNRFLDRGVLIGTEDDASLGFFNN